MDLYPQPASLFCTRLPPDTILDIVFQLAATDPLGPPRHLPPLFLLCKYVNHILTAHRKAIFAHVFSLNFDTSAARRRFGPSALTTSALAFQLKKQTLALKRLRNPDFDSEHFLSDLWTVFIMFMENDGRNYRHLIEYARIPDLVDSLMSTRLWALRERLGSGWPLEFTPNALIVWLLWFTMTPDRLRSLIPHRRQQYMDLLRPYVLGASQYAWTFAPDNHFTFPIHPSLRDGSAFPQGTDFALLPVYRDPQMVAEYVLHFGREVPITSPLVATAAKMVYIMLNEAVPYVPSHHYPVDRAHADPTQVIPTHEDFREWASVRGVRLYEPGSWDQEDTIEHGVGGPESHSSAQPEQVSAGFDNDWARLTTCLNPYGGLALKPAPYTLGTLSGLFAGRQGTPDLLRYLDLIRSPTMPDPNTFPRIIEQAVYVSFREHLCIDPATPAPVGGLQHGFDDGLTNAYFPEHTSFTHVGNALRVSAPGASAALRYEDFVEGRPSSHDPATCGRCAAQRRDEEAALRARIAANAASAAVDTSTHATAAATDIIVDDDEEEEEDSDVEMDSPSPRSRRSSTGSGASHVSYVYGDAHDPGNQMRSHQMMLEHDPGAEAILAEMMADGVPDADAYGEFVRRECDGVADIVITGTTLKRHAEAWHDYRWYGRVRKWDGLVVLVREPTGANLAEGWTNIFRGYVVGGRTFVGSWRSYADNLSAVVHEGPFALSRVALPEPPRA